MELQPPDADRTGVTTPLVHCAGCDRAWHSPTMADGLREVGSCPRCGGILVFADAVAEPEPMAAEPGPAPDATVAPHLVLGVPRR